MASCVARARRCAVARHARSMPVADQARALWPIAAAGARQLGGHARRRRAAPAGAAGGRRSRVGGGGCLVRLPHGGRAARPGPAVRARCAVRAPCARASRRGARGCVRAGARRGRRAPWLGALAAADAEARRRPRRRRAAAGAAVRGPRAPISCSCSCWSRRSSRSTCRTASRSAAGRAVPACWSPTCCSSAGSRAPRSCCWTRRWSAGRAGRCRRGRVVLAVAVLQLVHGLTAGADAGTGGAELRVLLGFGAAGIALPIVARPGPARGAPQGADRGGAGGRRCGAWCSGRSTSRSPRRRTPACARACASRPQGAGRSRAGCSPSRSRSSWVWRRCCPNRCAPRVRARCWRRSLPQRGRLVLTYERTFWLATSLALGVLALRATPCPAAARPGRRGGGDRRGDRRYGGRGAARPDGGARAAASHRRVRQRSLGALPAHRIAPRDRRDPRPAAARLGARRHDPVGPAIRGRAPVERSRSRTTATSGSRGSSACPPAAALVLRSLIARSCCGDGRAGQPAPRGACAAVPRRHCCCCCSRA